MTWRDEVLVMAMVMVIVMMMLVSVCVSGRIWSSRICCWLCGRRWTC